MFKAIAHRPVQACVIAALSALVTACAVLTPLYQRALERASVVVTLDQASSGEGGLQLISDGVVPDISAGIRDNLPPLTTAALFDEIPAKIARRFDRPVDSQSVAVATAPGADHQSTGPLVWRAGACEHLDLTAGSCPASSGQIAISTADADNFELRPGSRIGVVEDLPPSASVKPATATLTVSGVYRNGAGPYWDGWQLTGASGTQPDRTDVLHDAWLTDQATLTGATRWANPSTRIDLAVDRGAVGVDELLELGPAVAALQLRESAPREGPSVQVRSGLASIADTVREGRHQARTTVPALMVPLGVLGLVVLWMALGAAAEQRRPEVALARLRGRGTGGARAHLLRELLAVVLAGVPVGFVVAVGLAWLARTTVLPGDVPLELRLPVGIALLLSVAAVGATTALVSIRVSREPIASLLRRVPPRRTGWALGTGDAVAVTAAVLIVGAFATGKVTGPVAVAAPAILALAVGLVLSRLAIPVATRAGRRLLTRGLPGPAVALLQLSRRPGTRSVVALLTVASAILVFAADAVAVGSRNRDLAAAQQVGAPLVATISGGTVAALRDALATTGHDAREVTPVVVQHPQSQNAQTDLYVEPDAFARIASLPDRSAARAALRAVASPDVEPLTVTGTHLLLDVATRKVELEAPVTLSARLLRHDGTIDSVLLRDIAPGASSARHPVDVPIDCAEGCILTGWSVTTVPANDATGDVVVSAVHTDLGTHLQLGTRDDWSVPDPAATDALVPSITSNGSLRIALNNEGRSDVVLEHRWVPDVFPAVTSGSLSDKASEKFFEGTGLDGQDLSMDRVATLPWFPRAGRDAAVANLDSAVRTGAALSSDAALEVWFARDDKALLSRVTDAVEAGNMSVVGVVRESKARSTLADSAAAWSLQLGALVGVACLLVAALGLMISAAASWRSRTRDLAILKLNGSPPDRIISLGEQLPAIIVAVLAGAVAGVLAAHWAMPTIPLLPSAPRVDLYDLSVAWTPVLVLAAVATVVLCLLGWLLGILISRRSGLDRIRDSA